MKKQFSTLLLLFFWFHASLFSFSLELNTSYDYFRSLPDSNWSGNTGLLFMGNAGMCLTEWLGVQVGGSYGLYNWDGRGNVVFKNPKNVQQQAFVTAGVFSSLYQVNGGVVYDRLFTKHLGIFDSDPSIDQIRFQGGYQFCCEEIGIWGTASLTTAHKRALHVPDSYRAISQINLFWSHFFENFGKTTIWAGVPYKKSRRFHHSRPGEWTAGFALRAPLTDRLFVDGYGSYMKAHHSQGAKQSKNYAANICVGITYLFGSDCCDEYSIYMPVANHSNFLVDTSLN